MNSLQPPFYLPNSEFLSFVVPQNSFVCLVSLGSVIFPGLCQSIRRPVINKTDFPSPNGRILLNGHSSKKAFNDLQLCYPPPLIRQVSSRWYLIQTTSIDQCAERKISILSIQNTISFLRAQICKDWGIRLHCHSFPPSIHRGPKERAIHTLSLHTSFTLVLHTPLATAQTQVNLLC